VAAPAEPRVSTGNPSLDAMLEGGLVAHRPYLVVGPSGTGKTTLGLQFLCDGVRRGERSLLVTLEEPPNEARVNHRGLSPEIDLVEVFDAIPDIMRYERTPFKDIASVRSAIPFANVPLRIRQSPELTSVEVTITALEQMLRTEVIRKGYTRLVVDSLTALQYFCMKGFEPVAGAQSFLRFLSDLRVTTILTVEAPLEDVESAERSLARGEIRLFRWELDGKTVRAIGVEKFRGSSHDVRLHPYRIGPQGIDVNLDVTISRDTRQIIEPIVRPTVPPAAATQVAPFVSSVTPLVDEVRDLVLLGADVAPARTEIEAALAATSDGHPDQARAHLSRVSSLVMGLVDGLSHGPRPISLGDASAAGAFQRVLARADTVRTGLPPTSLPPASVLQVQLGALLSLLPAPTPAPAPAPPPEAAQPPEVAPVAPSPPSVAAPPPEALPAAPPVAPASPAPAPVDASRPPIAPPPAEVVAPAKPSVVSHRPSAIRALPPPPAPRPPAGVARSPKVAGAPAGRPGPKKFEAPPPLPSKVAPPLPSAPPPSPPAHAVPVPTTRTARGAPASVSGAAPARAPSAGKKRRKAAAPSTAKKPPAPVPATLPETVPIPPAEPVPPPPAAPHHEAVEAPKPRRRAARKRKAPPVVSVEVEPPPPADVGTSEQAPPPDDPPDPSPPPEV